MENKYTMEVHNTVMKNIFLKNPQYVLEFCLSVFLFDNYNNRFNH